MGRAQNQNTAAVGSFRRGRSGGAAAAGAPAPLRISAPVATEIRIAFDDRWRSVGDYPMSAEAKIQWDMMRNSLTREEKVLGLYGPSGSSKSATFEQVAAVFEAPYVEVTPGDGDVEVQLTAPSGETAAIRLTPEAAAGLPQWLSEGMFIGVDERLADPAQMARLHKVLREAAAARQLKVSSQGAESPVELSADTRLGLMFDPAQNDPRLSADSLGDMLLLPAIPYEERLGNRATDFGGADTADVVEVEFADKDTARRLAELVTETLERANTSRDINEAIRANAVTANSVRPFADLLFTLRRAAADGKILAEPSEEQIAAVAADMLMQAYGGSRTADRDALTRLTYLTAHAPSGTSAQRLRVVIGDVRDDLHVAAQRARGVL